MGRNYRLKVVTGTPKLVILKNGRFLVIVPEGSKNPKKIKDALIQWYRIHAENKLKEKVERYSKIIGVQPKSVGIKTFKSRWGGCSKTGQILFNWKIIIAPTRIVDYVVVHELCHMREHNHSKEFWECVEIIISDYMDCKKWLKLNGMKIVI